MANKNYPLQRPGFSQADNRAYAVWYDQHKCARFPLGRPWWSVVERPAEGAAMPMPVGELQPGHPSDESQAWHAPWYPDPSVIAKNIGRASPGASPYEHKFKIDYIQIINDRKHAMEEYYNRAVIEGMAQGFAVPNFGDPIEYRLRQIVGKPPQSPRIPEAAMAEDPWILGFSEQENEALARLLGHGQESVETPKQAINSHSRVSELEAQLAATNAIVQKMADAQKLKDERAAKARAGIKKKVTV